MNYQYHFIEKDKTKPLFIIFHGHGQNEFQFIDEIEFLCSHCSILSIRGNVEDQGHLRYFKRYSQGQPDYEDLEFRANELLLFIKNKVKELGYETNTLISFGFSNGANIITAMNQVNNSIFDYNLIAHGTKYLNKPILNCQHVFISVSENDKMIPAQNTIKMASEYQKSCENVFVYHHQQGHKVTQEELSEMKAWLALEGAFD